MNRVSEGEVIQLLNIHDTTLDEARYFDVIERKTGVLFEAAARMASVVAGASKEVEDKMAEYAFVLAEPSKLLMTCSTTQALRTISARIWAPTFAKEK